MPIFLKTFLRMVFSSVAGAILFFFIFAAYLVYDHFPISNSPAFEGLIGFLVYFLLFIGPPCGFGAVIIYHFLATRHGSIGYDKETRCRKCGYILKGLTEPRCSECGERI